MNDFPSPPDTALRFGGIARLYGLHALEHFQNSHVAVIGLGGVGSWAAEALVRSGIGELSLFDLDDVCTSNINRQLQALDSTVGRLKIDVSAERLLDINPQLIIHRHPTFVTAANVADCLPEMDYVVDAIDSVKHKVALLAHCRRQKLKVITAGGAGGLQDPRQIETADLSRTYHDALLAKVRKQLRQEYRFPSNPKRRFGIEAVFSSEQPVFPGNDGEVCATRANATSTLKLDCSSGYGASMAVTATFGQVAAARVLQALATQAQESFLKQSLKD